VASEKYMLAGTAGIPYSEFDRNHPPLLTTLLKFAAMLRIFALLVALASGTELDKSSWDAATAGKTVFVKFLAPW